MPWPKWHSKASGANWALISCYRIGAVASSLRACLEERVLPLVRLTDVVVGYRQLFGHVQTREVLMLRKPGILQDWPSKARECSSPALPWVPSAPVLQQAATGSISMSAASAGVELISAISNRDCLVCTLLITKYNLPFILLLWKFSSQVELPVGWICCCSVWFLIAGL